MANPHGKSNRRNTPLRVQPFAFAPQIRRLEVIFSRIGLLIFDRRDDLEAIAEWVSSLETLVTGNQ